MADTPGTVTRLYVGTSGFSYPTWRPGFYPAGTQPRDFLRLYAEHLPSVELNTSGYQLPSEESFARWADQTPERFRFAVKMSRQITQGGRVDLIPTFCERVRKLGERLGPIRVQLPETRSRDDGFLRLFLDSLDPALRYAFEVTHESWAGAAGILDGAGVALVGSLEGSAPFRYVRFREPPYDEAELAEWANRLRPVADAGVELYCYFRHEDEPSAPAYARRLLELMEVPQMG